MEEEIKINDLVIDKHGFVGIVTELLESGQFKLVNKTSSGLEQTSVGIGIESLRKISGKYKTNRKEMDRKILIGDTVMVISSKYGGETGRVIEILNNSLYKVVLSDFHTSKFYHATTFTRAELRLISEKLKFNNGTSEVQNRR